MSPLRTACAFSLALLALAGCASLRPVTPRELLDERNGDMLWVASTPLVFARDRSDVAAFARDYVTLVGVEVDRAGHYEDYLLAYRWSTVDPRMLPRPEAKSSTLRILAEGRRLELTALESQPETLAGRSELGAPAVTQYVTRVFRVDGETLRFLATSRKLSVQLPQEPLDTPFALWKDGRAALRELATRATAP